MIYTNFHHAAKKSWIMMEIKLFHEVYPKYQNMYTFASFWKRAKLSGRPNRISKISSIISQYTSVFSDSLHVQNDNINDSHNYHVQEKWITAEICINLISDDSSETSISKSLPVFHQESTLFKLSGKQLPPPNLPQSQWLPSNFPTNIFPATHKLLPTFVSALAQQTSFVSENSRWGIFFAKYN